MVSLLSVMAATVVAAEAQTVEFARADSATLMALPNKKHRRSGQKPALHKFQLKSCLNPNPTTPTMQEKPGSKVRSSCGFCSPLQVKFRYSMLFVGSVTGSTRVHCVPQNRSSSNLRNETDNL